MSVWSIGICSIGVVEDVWGDVGGVDEALGRLVNHRARAQVVMVVGRDKTREGEGGAEGTERADYIVHPPMPKTGQNLITRYGNKNRFYAQNLIFRPFSSWQNGPQILAFVRIRAQSLVYHQPAPVSNLGKHNFA